MLWFVDEGVISAPHGGQVHGHAIVFGVLEYRNGLSGRGARTTDKDVVPLPSILFSVADHQAAKQGSDIRLSVGRFRETNLGGLSNGGEIEGSATQLGGG